MRALVALTPMLVLLFAGCGKKGDLRAPELATPRVIENLTATSVPNGVSLTWRRPTEYVDGSALKDLVGSVCLGSGWSCWRLARETRRVSSSVDAPTPIARAPTKNAPTYSGFRCWWRGNEEPTEVKLELQGTPGLTLLPPARPP